MSRVQAKVKMQKAQSNHTAQRNRNTSERKQRTQAQTWTCTPKAQVQESTSGAHEHLRRRSRVKIELASSTRTVEAQNRCNSSVRYKSAGSAGAQLQGRGKLIARHLGRAYGEAHTTEAAAARAHSGQRKQDRMAAGTRGTVRAGNSANLKWQRQTTNKCILKMRQQHQNWRSGSSPQQRTQSNSSSSCNSTHQSAKSADKFFFPRALIAQEGR